MYSGLVEAHASTVSLHFVMINRLQPKNKVLLNLGLMKKDGMRSSDNMLIAKPY